jgi:signal transduction histidine kinase
MARRRVSITAKLAGALAVPLAALSLVAGLEVGKSVRDAREVARQTDLATASIGPSGILTAIMHERNYTGLWLLGSEDVVEFPVKSLADARQKTDAARAAFEAEVDRKGGAVARIYRPVLAQLDELDALRADVDAYDGTREIREFNPTADKSFAGYSKLVTELADRNSVLSMEIRDEQLRRGVELIDKGGREIDRVSHLVRFSLLTAVTGDRRLTSAAEIATGADQVKSSRDLHDKVVALASGPYAAAGQNLKVESDATGLLEMGPELLRTGNVNVPGMLRAISLQDDESYYGFLRDVAKIVQDRADQLNDEAHTRSQWYLGAAALIMAAAVVAIVLVSRSIVRPLKDLTRQSIAMAERRLPAAVRSVLETPVGEDVEVPELEPVTVHSSDEVAAVAETLNTVQSAAVTLAVDQALLRRNVADAFVNLARRNQNLLSRQLDFITDLERDETRTDTLDNLFRLDHLATRMRRNAESLLVLAGAEASRQWSGPVRLHDVVRAALGEVEDYQRVILHNLEGATVLGSAASDLAHLLAELIENALRFSPPDKDVEVSGRSRTGSYLLLIADDGLGMTDEDIAAANERLSRNEMFSLASPRYLGHYVAGNLAARHGIAVRLYRSPCSGITVAVELPAPLLAPGLALDTGPTPAASIGGPAPALAAAGPFPPAPAPPERSGSTLHPMPALAAAPFVPVPDDGYDGFGNGGGHAADGYETYESYPGYGANRRGNGGHGGNGHRHEGPRYAAPPAPMYAAPSGPLPSVPMYAAPSGPLPSVPVPPSPPVPPPPGPTGFAMVPGLARRIPGAQLPQTAVRGLRRSPGPPPPAAPDEPAPGSPDDVYRVLTNYVAGLDRGRQVGADPAPATGQ